MRQGSETSIEGAQCELAAINWTLLLGGTKERNGVRWSASIEVSQLHLREEVRPAVSQCGGLGDGLMELVERKRQEIVVARGCAL